jgi:predicted nucleic acid-binding protein
MRQRLLFDTSVYITILRDETFAREFRPRYLKDIPRIHFSSVVIQELLAGARTPQHKRQAADLYEPFERAKRIVAPSHSVWKDAGTLFSLLADQAPQFRSKLSQGFLNDVLIALSGRFIGATIVTRNGEDFQLIQQFKSFSLEVIA